MKIDHRQFDTADRAAKDANINQTGLKARFSKAFGIIVGREKPKENKPKERSRRCWDAYSEQIDHVIAFLKKHNLPPYPENYLFVWEYQQKFSTPMREAVSCAIESDGKLTQTKVREIIADHLGVVTIERLTSLMNNSGELINQGYEAIENNNKGSRKLNDKLEKSISKMTDTGDVQGQMSPVLDLVNAIMRQNQDTQKKLADAKTKMQELNIQLDNVRTLASTDHLTGLPNRRSFENEMKRAIIEARENQKPLCISIIDLDHFKQINDQHGHDTGDRVLKRIGKILHKAIENSGLVARLGGEEFVILLEDSDAKTAKWVLDQLRNDLKGHKFINRDTNEPIGVISFSAGIAQWAQEEEGELFLHRADQALYHAKEMGRDRCIVATSTET